MMPPFLSLPGATATPTLRFQVRPRYHKASGSPARILLSWMPSPSMTLHPDSLLPDVRTRTPHCQRFV